MEFNKEIRNKIYCKALKLFLKNESIKKSMCGHLRLAVMEIYNISEEESVTIVCRQMKTNFPEIYRFREENNFSGFWFPLTDYKSRIDIFNLAITDTK